MARTITAEDIISVKAQAEAQLGVTPEERELHPDVVKVRQIMSVPDVFDITVNRYGRVTHYTFKPEDDGPIELPPLPDFED